MARFIETSYWNDGQWKPVIINVDCFEKVIPCCAHPHSTNGRPACVVATYANCKGKRWVYLDLDWPLAIAAFAAKQKEIA